MSIKTVEIFYYGIIWYSQYTYIQLKSHIYLGVRGHIYLGVRGHIYLGVKRQGKYVYEGHIAIGHVTYSMVSAQQTNLLRVMAEYSQNNTISHSEVPIK